MIQLPKFRFVHRHAVKTHSSSAPSSVRWNDLHAVVAVLLIGFFKPAFAEELPPVAPPVEEAIQAPSDLENAKSNLLQLDRDLARLKHDILMPNRTVLLFGLTPLSKLTVNTLAVSINGRPLPVRKYDQGQLDTLLKGGMDTVMDANLPVGDHVFDITVLQNNRKQTTQQIQFKKTVAKNIMGIKLIEQPGPGELPLKLVEWSQHD
jgi:hypothetical protein